MKHSDQVVSATRRSRSDTYSLTQRYNVSTDLTDVTPTQLDSEDDECDCSAGSCLDPTDIPARTKTATIQITVSAKRNLAAVANLASRAEESAVAR